MTPTKKIRPILVFYQKKNDSITIMKPVAEFEHLNVSLITVGSLVFPHFLCGQRSGYHPFYGKAPKKGRTEYTHYENIT